MTAAIETLTYYFFLLHIPITLLVDLSPLYPAISVFSLSRLLREFYVSKFEDPLLAGKSVPGGWFFSFLLLEGIVQLPICIFVVLQYKRDKEKSFLTRLIILVYAIQVMTTTWGCLFELLSFTGLSWIKKVGLIGFYAPYLLIPAIMAWFSAGELLSHDRAVHEQLAYLCKRHNQQQKTKTIKKILITGANSGVGFGIVQQLIDQYSIAMTHKEVDLILILSVRNLEKARSIKSRLLSQSQQFGDSLHLEFILMDLTSMQSVEDAFKVLNEGITDLHIDTIICNAGMAQFTHLDIRKATIQALTHPIKAISEPNYKVQSVGGLSKDGLGITFQANFFGHYYLCRRLEEANILKHNKSIIIWMSSLEATNKVFKSDDIQGLLDPFAYESSKRLTDIVWSAQQAHVENDSLKVRQYLVHPGFCATNIVAEMFPRILVPTITKLWTYTFYFARFCGSRFHTATAYNGAYAAARVAIDPDAYVPSKKWGSAGLWDGKPVVSETAYDAIDEDEANRIAHQVESLRRLWLHRLQNTM